MSREVTITPIRTYASAANARKAVVKSGDEGIRHFIAEQDGRFFPLFIVTEGIMADTGIHFRWNVIG